MWILGYWRQKDSNLFFGFLLFVTCVQCQLQFLDVSSLQAALPDSQLTPTFQSGIAEPWLPQNTLNPYFSSAGQGGPSRLILEVQTF